MPPDPRFSQALVHRDACACLPAGFNIACPWVRGVIDGEFVGHVKACPSSGKPCPCLPGSTSEAYCFAQVQLAEDRR